MSETETTLAIIGGSGLYNLDGLESVAEHDIETPWGKPSDPILEGRLAGVRMLFLPRHGQRHTLAVDHHRGARRRGALAHTGKNQPA